MKSNKGRRASAQNVTVPSSLRTLTEVQETVSELAADMIVNGGHADDVAALLSAVIRHQSRRMFPERLDHNKAVDSTRAIWQRRLAAHWPEEPKRDSDQKTEEPRTNAVKDIIEANVRQKLRSAMTEFMDRTKGLADAYLMLDIFTDWRSGRNELGEAFAYQLEASHTYVRVPWSEEKRFRKLATVLENE